MSTANRFRFRAWSKHSKEMLQDMNDSATPELWFDGSLHLEYDCTDVTDDLVLMQSTGLLDANGVEIFEGDVLAFDYGEQGKDRHEYTGVIVYRDGGFFCKNNAHGFHLSEIMGDNSVRWSICNGMTSPFYYSCENIRAIGNIHENPELIQKGGAE